MFEKYLRFSIKTNTRTQINSIKLLLHAIIRNNAITFIISVSNMCKFTTMKKNKKIHTFVKKKVVLFRFWIFVRRISFVCSAKYVLYSKEKKTIKKTRIRRLWKIFTVNVTSRDEEKKHNLNFFVKSLSSRL